MDRNIRAGGETFARHGEVLRLDGRAIAPGHLRDADALIVRSVTRVDSALLTGSAVRFVGSTTIGTDHLDIDFLQQAGIRWASAPGCNADAAAQYTLAMLWLACERLGRRLSEQSVGVVGCGNVGSRLRTLLNALGCRVLANDPPLADTGIAGLVTLDEALACDIVSLHVPLTQDGPYPTWQLIGERRLNQMLNGALLVNTARGAVVEGRALLSALNAGRLHAALDVWPGEPHIDAELLRAVAVATPHVAGYSDDGKRNGALAVYDAFCSWANITERAQPDDPGPGPVFTFRDGAGDPDQALGELLNAACFVRRHDAALRELAALGEDARAAGFDRLRRDYPPRRDFQAWQVRDAGLETARLCRKLGFSVIDTA
jgi:erythronate-4-phosphate dehydrogenase